MLFGRKKPGFIVEEEVKPEEQADDKKDLLGYLEELPEVEEDEFGDVEMQDEQVQEIELTKAQHLAEYIRLRTQGILLTSEASLRQEVEDFAKLKQEWETDETCQDIVFVKGNKDRYYYSTKYMSNNYAMIAALVEEKDLPKTIAAMVRFNCKTYPVPTPFSYFERSPYLASQAQIDRAIAMLESQEEFKDIQILTNNVGDKFFYSTDHMSFKYARALANVDEYID